MPPRSRWPNTAHVPSIPPTLALAVSLAAVASACGGAAAGPPPTPEVHDEPRGFGEHGDPAAKATDRAVTGEVRGRAVRLGAAFLLTPDREGPVELHAFEGAVDHGAVCPAGLSGDAPGLSLRVTLLDTRHADDPTLVTLVDGEHPVNVSRVVVDVTGRDDPGSTALATIDVDGSDGTHLRGTMPAHVCVDERSD